MDAFNYLSVMVSIVLGLGMTRLFAGIGNLVQIRRRVKRYWLHTAWVLLLIVLHVHMWWSFWAMRQVADWTYARFVYVLIGPGSLVIASHIIIPEMPDGRIEVDRYYFDIAPLFFGFLTATAVWDMCLETAMGLRTFLVPFRLMQLTAVLTFAACSAFKSRRIHAAALAVVVVLLACATALSRFRFGHFDLH